MYVSLSTFVQTVTSCPLGSSTNTLPDLDHVSVSNQGLLPILQAIYLQSGCESFQTDRKYIQALSTREFDGQGYEPTSYSKFNKEFDTMITPASGFLPPGSGFLPSGSGFLPPGLGPGVRVWVLPPASRPSDLSYLRINGNLPLIRYQLGQEGVSLDPRKRGRRHDLHYKYRFLNLRKGVEDVLDQSSQFRSRQGKVPYLEDLLLRHADDRLVPAITINQMNFHAHCSTSTTLLAGSGHDLQLISRVPRCSLKHLDTSCSLQHIDMSTICSGHVPPRTDDSYQLQSYVLPRLRAY
ncbi:hypothetical protein DY000_02032115 [Brassica cretica]|uniref:Uncharacterized protein n=1 Tax=Brassica cretica TaxID=69181 RepID=A0ABQ7DM58_BRACR|nr:hypothetical protein DY000_02032115 [Brassica cretica]